MLMSSKFGYASIYNMGLRFMDIIVMGHFLALLSILSDLDPAYHPINPCTRSSQKRKVRVRFVLLILTSCS